MPANEAMRTAALERRRAAAQQAAREAGLDGLVVYGSHRHSLLAANPAWYLTGFRQMGPHLAVILPAEGEATVVMTPAWDLPRAREAIGVSDLRAAEPEGFLAAVKAAVQARGLTGRKLGLAAGGAQPQALTRGLPDALGARPQDADKLVSDLARIRDDWSMTCTREAIRIAEESYDWLLDFVRPGMTEMEMGAELDADIRRRGGQDNFQLLSASQHNRSVHRPTERVLARGDVILAEITPAVEGEFMQICRTAVLGPASEVQKEKFALLDTSLRAGIAAAKPGTHVHRVVEAMNAPIVAAGYEVYTKPPYMRTRGHSMAMGSMDPELALHQDHTLLTGMALVMHPNQYIPETGYMMCGEPIEIAADGCRPLTSRFGTLDEIV